MKNMNHLSTVFILFLFFLLKAPVVLGIYGNILAGTPPVADFTHTCLQYWDDAHGSLNFEINADASLSSDSEDPISSLLFRWTINYTVSGGTSNSNVSGWLSSPIYHFLESNVWVLGTDPHATSIMLEVKDTEGLIGTSTKNVVDLEYNPYFTTNPQTVDFGSVQTGTSSNENLQIVNNWHQLREISLEMQSSGSAFQILSSTLFDLGAGATQNITLRFDPTASINYEDTLLIHTQIWGDPGDGSTVLFDHHLNKVGLEGSGTTGLKVTDPDLENIAWKMNREYTILWDHLPASGSNVEIELYKNGLFERGIVSSTNNNGSYPWIIPNDLEPDIDYQVKITSVSNPSMNDMSDNRFRITDDYSYEAPMISNSAVPVLDGNLNDPVWAQVEADSLLWGGDPNAYSTPWTNFSDHLVTWKAVWCDITNKLYVGVDVQDDIQGTFDNGPSTSNYKPWHDDALEFFTDGNHDGGDFWGLYGPAQQWRVIGDGNRDLYNFPTSGIHLYGDNDFETAIQSSAGGNWTCEAVFVIYDDLPGSVKDLAEGDTIGWEVRYNDSDDESNNGSYYTTDHQSGWFYIGKAYRDADSFGDLLLGSSISSGIEHKDGSMTPESFALHQNCPNPFNPVTIISYAVPKASTVRLAIYDIRGSEVKVLVNENQKPGVYEVHWNSRDDLSHGLASGVYFYRLEADAFTQTRKMLLVR